MLDVQELSAISKTANHVKRALLADCSGHDWWHIYRVWNTAKHIQSRYPSADNLVVELAALLHDIADWKFHNGDADIGAVKARRWLQEIRGITPTQIDHICSIVKNISFKGNKEKAQALSLEGQIVQDADRLDAMGAIGIARVFAYGGHKGRIMHDPNIPYRDNLDSLSYIDDKVKSTSLNHFYEKLLLIKDLMNTEYAKEIAASRHEFMVEYLSRFFDEWNGDC